MVKIGHCKSWYYLLVERPIKIYPVFLELIEQIRIKIGYGEVMILSTSRMNCHNLPRFSRVDWENGNWGED